MKELIKHLEDITPFKVDSDKLFSYLYENKVTADRLFFKLITASRLVRQDYLQDFIDYNIYIEEEK